MKKLLKDSFKLTFFTISIFPLSYMIRLLLSRSLTLEEFGFFYALVNFFEIIHSFNDLGFSETQSYFLPKFIVQNRLDKIKAAFKTQILNQLVTTLAIGAIIFFFAKPLSENFFHFTNGEKIIKIFVLTFIFKDFLANLKVLFFSYQEAMYYGSQEFLRIILTFFLITLLFFSNALSLFSLAVLWSIIYVTLALFYLVLFVVKHREIFSSGNYPIKDIYKEFLPFVLPTLLSNSAGIFFSSGTQVFLAFTKGVRDVGLYNIAQPISNIFMAVMHPIASQLKPYVSQIDEQDDKSHIQKILNIILNAGVFFQLPIVLVLFFYSEESIRFLFGSKFVDASGILKIIGLEIFLNSLNVFVFGVVVGLGLQKKRAKVIYLSSLINMVLSIILIPLFGGIGVALSNTLYALTALVGGIYIIKGKVNFALPIKNYLKMALLSVVFIFVQLSFKLISSDFLSMQFVLFIFKVSFGLALYYWVGIVYLKIIDINFVRRVLPKKIAFINTKFGY